MKRLVSSLLITALSLALLPGLALGAAPGVISPGDTSQGVTPLGDDMTGYEFVPGSVLTLSDTVNWSHDHYNYGSLPDSVTYQVSRTASASCSTSVSVSINGLLGMVAMRDDVDVGESKTVSWSVTFNIPAYTWAELSAGSHRKKPTGTENYWFQGVLKSSKSVYGTCTAGGYSKKVEHPL